MSLLQIDSRSQPYKENVPLAALFVQQPNKKDDKFWNQTFIVIKTCLLFMSRRGGLDCSGFSSHGSCGVRRNHVHLIVRVLQLDCVRLAHHCSRLRGRLPIRVGERILNLVRHFGSWSREDSIVVVRDIAHSSSLQTFHLLCERLLRFEEHVVFNRSSRRTR